MIRREILLLVLFLPVVVKAQLSDDFSDGNFTSNPEWVGDSNVFAVQEGLLRLTDQEAGQACLATASTLALEVQWEFWVRLAFTPTDNNHPKIYLASDAPDLKGPLHGYFIQIGKNGGENKKLFLVRQDGEETLEILAGTQNLAALTNNIIRIRVTRNNQGLWEVAADATGGQLFVQQGSAVDMTYNTSGWFGLVCNYTVSNCNRFYFDDFIVQELVPDVEPPAVTLLELASANQLILHFSEPVEPISAETTGNYQVSQGVGAPMIASRDPQQPNLVSLVFAQNFQENIQYALQISLVEDLAGNAMETTFLPFVFYVPQRFDVVFNELLVDPTPQVGLPPHEYIELFNTSGFNVNLNGWILQHGDSRRTLPFIFIESGGYLLLACEDAFPSLQSFGPVASVPGLPANALTNAGNSLLLFDPEERLVAFVNYSEGWYGQPAKSQGGWSIEKIDPLNFCEGPNNWTASNDPLGGTPAGPNTVLAPNPDVTPPVLLRTGYLAEDSIKLYFSESMDEAGLLSLSQSGDFGAGNVLSVCPQLPDFSSALLVLESPLIPGNIYEIDLPAFLTDCAGNPLEGKTAKVAVPKQAQAFDVVINEVLFNPPEGGSRFIELYNRSEKVIDLKDLILASKDTIQGFLTHLCPINPESSLLFPGDFTVLTTDPEAVRKTFMTNRPNAFIKLAALPSMTNTGGVLALARTNLEEIDLLTCHEDMHFALLTTLKGVALERVNYHQPTQDRSNWHSAAQSVGFGTPGYQNSQYHATLEPVEGEVVVSPEIFSPDNDGHEDLLGIHYRFEKPGYVASLLVFDSRGRLIRRLVQAELLAAEGIFTWDGTTDKHLKAPIGMYLIHLEIMDLEGNVKRIRRTAVLGGKL
ncbi:MAG: lamin tail domain-containing protein [Bacteroides sp.]|nr:lamin tail domain-containing protein [Bacteroides sp.]